MAGPILANVLTIVRGRREHGKNGTTGVALIEVYDVAGCGSHVVNISTRSPVGTGDAVQIAGFVVGGEGPKTVLVRTSGPALGNLGVAGTLANPVLELHDRKAIVGYNDEWSSNPIDAAVLMTLAPGTHSAIVSSKTGSPGVALIEVYDVSHRRRTAPIRPQSSRLFRPCCSNRIHIKEIEREGGKERGGSGRSRGTHR